MSVNKRIAKNTVYMYIRMLVLLVVSLYTSRVVLQTLGISDYGIYNVVAGIVVLFSFISNALSTTTQRHLSFELGKDENNVSVVFSSCLSIHVILGFVVVIITEILGVWFLNSKMTIPPERMMAANVVLQFAIFSTFLNIVRVPYEATIIAHEKMSFYAYFCIAESVLKLCVAIAISYFSGDKLQLFAFLHFIVVLILLGVISLVCHKIYRFVSFKFTYNKGYYKYLLGFSGWTLLGSCAVVLETQGLNMVINVFYGVVVNATVGISNQVKSVIQQFVSGFQIALNPQLVMAESKGDKVRQYDLISKSSKYSYFIIFVLAIPIIFNLQSLLVLWLGEIPEYTATITSLVITAAMIESISAPLYTTIYAVGDIKKYQISVSIIKCLTILVGYIVSLLGVSPVVIFIIPCIVSMILLIYRLWYLKKRISISIRDYAKRVLKPIMNVVILGMLPILLKAYFRFEASDIFIVLLTTICVGIYTFIIIAVIGMTSNERQRIINIVKSKIVKI